MNFIWRPGTARRIVRAVLTNQIARFAPGLYLRLTGQTGRGGDEVRLDDVGSYFQQCVDDYLIQLKAAIKAEQDYFNGKRILEYGPGDLPGVAMALIAKGASQVVCVDRFPMVKLSPKNLQIVRILVERMEFEEREKLAGSFVQSGKPESGFNSEKIDYLVRPSGLSGLKSEIDVIVSRAVLEHVNDLNSTFGDMYAALKPGGIAIHLVDLKSHGLHLENPLDFLNWPAWLWSLMYSAKGVPNRLRVDAYREAAGRAGLKILKMSPTMIADQKDIEAVRPQLARQFRTLSNDDLSWMGFWLVCQKP